MKILNNFKGMNPLSIFILKRDRVRLPVWIVSITALTLAVAAGFTGLYPTAAERDVMAQTMINPAITSMFGPAYGIDNYTFGAMMAHQMLLFTALAVAIMSILLVNRHTRKDEEAGRIEVIRSLPVGKLANLKAVLVVMYAANIALMLVVGFGLWSLGIESIDIGGSLLYGAALAVTGMFFASLTALFAQISATSRGAAGYSFAFFGLAYIVRGIGDIGYEALSLISPLGLVLRAKVYVENLWWPVLAVFALSVLVGIFAFYLNTKRDLEAGFLKVKEGKVRASKSLLGSFGLALRLQRGTLIGWAVGLFALGASYGSVMGDIEDYFAGSEIIREILPDIEGASVTEQFMTILMVVMGIVATIPAMQSVLKLRNEEKRNRTEHIVGRAVSKERLMTSYFAMGVIVAVVMNFIALAGLWTASYPVMDDPVAFLSILSAGMVYIPALLTMVGLCVFLTGVLPNFTGFSWIYLAYSFFLMYFGDFLKVPELIQRTTPFGNIPMIPAEEFTIIPLILLTVVFALLTYSGYVGFRKRDLQG